MRGVTYLLGSVLLAMSACSADRELVPSVDNGGVNDVPAVDLGRDPGPTFCTGSSTAFCADFDQGRTPGAGWTGVGLSGGGDLDLIAATDGTSQPNALRATLPALDGSKVNAAVAQVAKENIPLGEKRHITIGLKAKIGDSKPATPNDVVNFLTLRAGLASFGLFRTKDKWFVSVVRKSAAVPTGNPGGKDANDKPLKITPPLETWMRLELDVVLSRTDGSVKLLVDGQEAVNETVATIGDVEPTALTLAVGAAHSSGTTASFKARYDDVTIALGP